MNDEFEIHSCSVMFRGLFAQQPAKSSKNPYGTSFSQKIAAKLLNCNTHTNCV
jgi:hypothetical protein